MLVWASNDRFRFAKQRVFLVSFLLRFLKVKLALSMKDVLIVLLTGDSLIICNCSGLFLVHFIFYGTNVLEYAIALWHE
jgi:hypothetical protein